MAEMLRRFEFPKDGAWTELEARALEGQTRVDAHGRTADVREEESLVILHDATGATVARVPFEPPADPTYREGAFDRTGDTYWMVLGDAMNNRLYAIDMRIGRIAFDDLGFAGEIWLLPDWDQDRTMVIGTHGSGCETMVYSDTLNDEGAIVAYKWRGSNAIWKELHYDGSCACPVHCRGGRIVAANASNLATFAVDSEDARLGPRTPPSRMIHPAATTKDRFAITTGLSVWVYDADTLEAIGNVATPQFGRYPSRPSVELLTGNRVLIGRDSPEKQRDPKAQYVELWQL